MEVGQQTLAPSDVLVDGFIARMFTSRDATHYFMFLLRTQHFIQYYGIVYHRDAWFITHNVNLLQGDVQHHTTPLLDHSIRATYGTVVPQRRWMPVDEVDVRRHVQGAVLQLPVFFVNRNGGIGFPLLDILRGCDRDLLNANDFATLGGKTTTHIRINWRGYRDWKRQIATRDETHARNPITVGRFMKHVGTSVDNFFRECMSNGVVSTDRRWEIGMNGGITPAHVKVIGVIHVSAGSWMPILQLAGYVI